MSSPSYRGTPDDGDGQPQSRGTPLKDSECGPFAETGSWAETGKPVFTNPFAPEGPTPTSAFNVPARDRAASTTSLPIPEAGGSSRRQSARSLCRPPILPNEPPSEAGEDVLESTPLKPRAKPPPTTRSPYRHRQSASVSVSMISASAIERADVGDEYPRHGSSRYQQYGEPLNRRISGDVKNLAQQQAASWNEFAYAYSQGSFDPLRTPLFPSDGPEGVFSAVAPSTPRLCATDKHATIPRPSSAPPSPVTGLRELEKDPTSKLDPFLHITAPSTLGPNKHSRSVSSDAYPTYAAPSDHPEMDKYDNIRHLSELRPFYEKHGFLPAPLPLHEPERLKALYSFNILYTSDDLNFDRIVHMIKLVFNSRVAFLSLLDGEANWYKSYSGLGNSASQIRRSIGFCAHVVLTNSDEPFVVLDTQKDWRFKNNPIVTSSPNLRFYAAAPLRTSDGYNVGTLALVDSQPRTHFSPRSRHILKEFAAIVMRELELWRDRLQLRMRDRIQRATEEFTRECLETKDNDLAKSPDIEFHLSHVYKRAAELVQTTLDLDECTILDISQFERVEVRRPDGSTNVIFKANPYAAGQSVNGEIDSGFGTVSAFPILTSTCPDEVKTYPLKPWEHGMVSKFLSEHRDGRIFNLAPPWLRSVYPSSLKYAMAVPIMDIDQHPFALICAHTHDKGKQFLEGSELQFLRSIGAIILSAVLRHRTLLADRSKNVLISSVSHELRTPLHGMLASGELLSDTPLDDNQEAFLATLRTCGLQLIETVNHVLDFAKLSIDGNDRTRSQIKFQRVNLAELIHSTMEGCWLGQRARSMQMDGESEIGSYYSPEAKGLIPSEKRLDMHHHLANVESVLDVGFREKGWNVLCETGGLRRIIMNLYNNSLKFTKEGYVQIMLRELRHAPGQKRIPVELRVIDTGKGIGKEFLKNQLFQPFAQENPLLPGTGLGLAIVGNIVTSDSIGGTLNVYSAENVGTEIRIQFEVEICEEDEQGDPVQSIDTTLGHGYTIAFLNYSPDHRGLQLQQEVMRNYGKWLGFSFSGSVDDADIVIVNETDISPDTAKRCRGKAMLLVISFKIHDKVTLEAMSRTESYTGILYKPMGIEQFSRALQASVRWSRDPTNPELLGALSQLNKAAERRKHIEESPHARHDSNKMMQILGHRPRIPLTEVSPTPTASPSPGRKQRRPTLDISNTNQPECSTITAGPFMTSPAQLTRRQSLQPIRPSPTRTSSAPSTTSSLSYSGEATPTTPTTPLTNLSPLIDRPPSRPSPSPGPTGFSTVMIGEGGVMLASCQPQSEYMALRQTRPPRIMVVEDNPINRRVLTALLKKRNFEYTEAVDGCAGVELFKSSPPHYWDAILMDITMPVMNGLEATSAIRHIEILRRAVAASPISSPTSATSPHLPRGSLSLGTPFEPLPNEPPAPNHHTKIFALTGLATAEDKRKAFASGVDGYLVKPVSLGTLDLLFKKIGF